MQLGAATWPAADASETELAVLPVGSTEQHGPHAPLGTDTLAAAAVAEGGVERSDHEVAVAPAIPVGVAKEHRRFAGTLWVSPETFRSYVHETVESLAAHGWTRVVVVNGHGGNVAPLEEVCARLSRDGTADAVAFTWFDAVDLEAMGVEMGHAGPVETSLLLELHPELVDETEFDRAAAGAADHWGEWVGGVNLAHDSDTFTTSGAVGDPTESSTELGTRLYEAATDRLATLLDAVATRPGGE